MPAEAKSEEKRRDTRDRLTQEDVRRLIHYCNQRVTEVSGLRSNCLEPRIPSGNPTPFAEARLLDRWFLDLGKHDDIGFVEAIKTRLHLTADGFDAWNLLALLFGPKAKEAPWDDFGDLAPIVHCATIARFRAERLFTQARHAHLEKFGRRPGLPPWLRLDPETKQPEHRKEEIRMLREWSPGAMCARVLRLDEQLPREPRGDELDRHARTAIERATRKASRDDDFIREARDQAEDLRADAEHAWVSARESLEKDIAKRQAADDLAAIGGV